MAIDNKLVRVQLTIWTDFFYHIQLKKNFLFLLLF